MEKRNFSNLTDYFHTLKRNTTAVLERCHDYDHFGALVDVALVDLLRRN
jgi:hypothetical protein